MQPAEDPSSTASVGPAPFEPVSASERILTLDVLRGIALLGVLVANIWLWFSGAVFMFPGLQEEVRKPTVDSAVFVLIAFFVSGKALSTFSILFGLGFAVQLMRAESRGSRIVPVYSRRLAVLLLLGILHGVLLWYGDILATYALLGFALLLFRRRRERTLLVWAAVMIVAIPIILGTIPLAMHAAGADMGPPPVERLAKMTRENQANLALFTSGSYANLVRGNVRMLKEMWLSPKALFVLMFFGLFLLGLYAGRRRIFEHPADHRVLLRRLAIWGFAIGVPATLVGIGLRTTMDFENAMTRPWFPLAMMATTALGAAPFALAYIATATLLLQAPRWKERLAVFAPVGRMALTNYLSQTLMCLAIYHGGGLMGHFRPTLNLIIAVLIFIVQMRVSAWWLSRYRFGPMEWLWRSLTYGHRQPMRLAQAPTAVRSW